MAGRASRAGIGLCAGLAAAALGGCATLERGTTDRLSIISDPPGATATTSLGPACTTPCSVEASRRDAFSVTIAKPGYVSRTVEVTTQISDAGAGFFMENVVTGGLGSGVDVATGSVLEHNPNPVTVTLVPQPAVVASRARPRPVR